MNYFPLHISSYFNWKQLLNGLLSQTGINLAKAVGTLVAFLAWKRFSGITEGPFPPEEVDARTE